MTERIESTILRNLIYNQDYFRKVIPHIKSEYFEELSDKCLFDEIFNFAVKYDSSPTKEVLILSLQNRENLIEDTYNECIKKIKTFTDEEIDQSWMVDATEKWCQDRAVYNALLQSIKIADGGDSQLSKDAIPGILQEALGVSFDEHIGHDYFEQAQERYDFYHDDEEKLPFDLEKLNIITGGGLPKKSLNILMAGPAVGKSMFMCHMASSYILDGKNVLYITMEMAEKRISERIDANLLDVNIKNIKDIPESIFNSRINAIAKKTQGKLIVKEYPTASAHAGHFRALLSELRLKKKFTPDVIIIDYLNICASARFKGASVNSYTYVKSIAEELRGIGVEYDVPVVSATQVNRGGYGNTDLDMTDTSESFGLPATADLMLGLMSSEELEQSGQIAVKQIKNRYGDVGYYRKFTLGVDKSKMKLYNVTDGTDQPVSSVEDEELFDPFVEIVEKQQRKTKFSEFVY